MKFYVDTDGHGEECAWHNPGDFPYVPVPVVSKHHVAPGYWDQVVRKLVGECTICPVRQEVVNTLAAENRALHKGARWHDLISSTVEFAAENWPQTPRSAAVKVFYEAQEIVDDPQDITEAADVLITVCSWLNATRHTADELFAAVESKMHVNRARAWERRGDGSYQHIEVRQ